MDDTEISQAVLGDRLRLSRQYAGLSQQKAADGTGIQRSAISDIESGQRKVNALELRALATLYGETLDHFLGGAPATVSGPEAIAQRLETVTANLHGYLEQRAAEIAQPDIEAAQASAAREVTAAEFKVQRADDLVDELRKGWEVALRRAHRAEHRLGLTHTAGECGACDAARVDADSPVSGGPGA